MREILFRGKILGLTDWSYGYYAKSGENHFILLDTDNEDNYSIVDPETVGQFTGLTDENGKRIFEGDIVKLTDKSFGNKWKAVVEFGNPNGNYTWGWQLKPIGKAKNVNTDILCWVEMEETGAFCEIIGNKWDNPELLEVKK